MQARPDLEERFASRWLVWAGGATIALGGGFLVKYSIDNELLGPLARVVVGPLLSLDGRRRMVGLLRRLAGLCRGAARARHPLPLRRAPLRLAGAGPADDRQGLLSDLSAPSGLWRALSFLGLGLSLVAVGWLYRRFVFPPKPRAAAG